MFIPKNLKTMKNMSSEICNSFASAWIQVDGPYYGKAYNIQFTIDPENPYFIVENNRIYNPDKTILYAEGTRVSNSNIVIDESVEKIASYAFYFREKTSEDKASLNKSIEYLTTIFGTHTGLFLYNATRGNKEQKRTPAVKQQIG